MKTLRKLALTGLAICSLANSYADSIYRGMRGPTTWQADFRVGYREKTNAIGVKTKAAIITPILKYWDGRESGKWGFVALPYKNLDSERKQSEGIGDLVIGGGPRGTIKLEKGTFNYLSHLVATIPTGDSSTVPTFGTGKVDLKAGFATTIITNDKTKELDASIEVTRTGKNKTSNEIYVGFMVGGKTSTNTRTTTGFKGSYKIGGKNDGNNLITWTSAFRYILPPKTNSHLEFWGDLDISRKGMPKGAGITGMIRYNF